MTRRPPPARTRAFASAARVLDRTGLLAAAGTLSASLEARRGHDRRVRFPWIRRRRRGSVSILLYHRVAPRPDPFLPAMPLDVFRAQMDVLARRFNVVSVDRAVRGMVADDLPERAVAITFDDGYRDNYTHAFPVLRALGLQATVFLTTGAIGSDRRLWHDRVFEAVQATEETVLEGFGRNGEPLDLTPGPARAAALDQLLSGLKAHTLAPAQRDARVEQIYATLLPETAAEAPERLMLDWSEVREMRAGGIDFGAHTVTHPILTQVSDAAARDEIERSKAEIEARIEEPVVGFAYPNGGATDFDERIRDHVRAAGFRWALTTLFGPNRAAGAHDRPDLFTLRRIIAEATDPAVFAAKLTFYDFADDRGGELT